MKKEIIFITGSMDKGGVERVISTLANYLCKDYRITIITLLSNKSLYLLDDSINVIHLSKEDKRRLVKLPIWIYKLNRIFKKMDSNNSIIISFVARINIVALIAKIFIKVPIIISERNDPKNDGRKLFTNILTIFLYHNANKIVFQTKYAKECFTNSIQEKGVIIYNPITVNTIKSKEKENKEIVSVGRLVKQKNQQLLINVFKKVSLKYPEYILSIYGDGNLKNKIEKQIKILDLEEKVILRGNVDNIHEHYKEACIFVLTSNFEGQSNALLEAMAMGMPCIATNIPGIKEIINEEDILLVDINNEEQLYNAIIELICDSNKRKVLGENSKKTLEKIKLNDILIKWELLIAETINKNRKMK